MKLKTREQERKKNGENAEKYSPHDGHTVGCICWRVFACQV